ncbi:MAG: hypothetical protein ACE5LS_00220 [Thermoplasmata archaeon]
MGHYLWLAVSLPLLLLAGVAIVVPLAQAHPTHLQIENDVLLVSRRLDESRWLAQSFVPSSDFFVSRVSLYVFDKGLSDFLQVSIRNDISGVPDTTNLTAGTVDGPAVDAWLDVDLSPYLPLTAGQTYWMVARSAMPQGDGYEWWESGTESAYPPGTGASSDDGVLWGPSGTDFAFRVFGFQQPAFTFDVSPSASRVIPGDSVVFRVNFTNTGSATSAGLWVNVSLPPELSFVGDDAASIGGVRTGAHNYSFTDVAPGAWSFNLTASVAGGVPNGTVAVTDFAFDADDHLGAPLTLESWEVALTFRNALLDLSLVLSTASVDPGDAIVLAATVRNVGDARAQNLRVQGTVDANLTYESSFPPGVYDAGTRTLVWAIPGLDPGAQVVLEWNGTVLPGTPDLASLTFPTTVEYDDPSATPLPPILGSATAGVRAPVFDPVLRFDRMAAERGDTVVATLFYNNTGTGLALQAWANWTLGSSFDLVALAPALSATMTPSGFSVRFTNVTPGPHALAAHLEVMRGMEDGLALGLDLDWEAADKNGNPLPPAILNGTVRLDAPAVVLALEAAIDRVGRGSTFTLNLTLLNTGRAPAVGTLELALPAGTTYLGDNGTFPVMPSTTRTIWNITSLGVNTPLVLGVLLHAEGGPGPRAFRFVLNYADGRGSPALSAFSNAATVEVVAVGGANPGLPWWSWLPLLGAAVPPAFFLLRRWRRSPVRLHEVFVVDRGGLVLAHRSDTLIEEKDEDIVAAAFTAVQEFVKYHFGRGSDESIRTLEFGERKILLEQGERHYVAVVFSGEETPHLRDSVRKLAEDIDRKYGYILSDWQGDSETIKGISQLLPRLWKH